MVGPIIGALLLASFLFKDGYVMLFWIAGLVPLGMTAILDPNMAGGMTILAASFAALLFSARMFLDPKSRISIIAGWTSPRDLLLLAIFILVSVTGAFLLPWLLAGTVIIYPMRPVALVSYPVPLAPTSSNFNQALNLLTDLGVISGIFALSFRPDFCAKYAKAILIGGSMVVVTGAADMVTDTLGLGSVLDVFRTASYVLMAESEVAGIRRVIGLMSEASSFGAVSVVLGSLLLFSRFAFDARTRLKLVYPLALGNVIFVILSTSSSAYAALAIALLLFAADVSFRLFRDRHNLNKGLLAEICVLIIFVFVIIVAILANQRLFDIIMSVLDDTIFNKSQSSSFAERSDWTLYGYNAFFGSYGLGIGVGSVRTSNFFVNILSSTGIIGTTAFALFVARALMMGVKSSIAHERELVHGARMTILVAFTTLYLVGTTPDFGILVSLLFGVSCGLTSRLRVRALSAAHMKAPLAPQPNRISPVSIFKAKAF